MFMLGVFFLWILNENEGKSLLDQRKPHSVHGGLRKENLIKLTVESSENKEKIRFKVHEVELAASPIVCLH